MSFRNEYKNLWEKSDKELEEIIKIKLKMISEGIYFDILKNWRRKPVKSTIGDPNTFDLIQADLVLLVMFLEQYAATEYSELYQLKFKQYINELFDTGAWIQTIRAWEDDPRFERRDQIKKDGRDLVFDTADEYEKYLKNKNLKEAIADSIKDELQGGRYDT
jgi:hypothetical protein|tara:strand:+ start:151 stop:636 length:486 start_codon:yes stop_codon:yes gene_type:complete